jgi:hypothetical protein
LTSSSRCSPFAERESGTGESDICHGGSKVVLFKIERYLNFVRCRAGISRIVPACPTSRQPFRGVSRISNENYFKLKFLADSLLCISPFGSDGCPGMIISELAILLRGAPVLKWVTPKPTPSKIAANRGIA